MKINIDKQKCIGCGSCLTVCPDFFKLGQDGKVSLKEKRIQEPVDEKDAQCIQEAVDICPIQAITVEKDK